MPTTYISIQTEIIGFLSGLKSRSTPTLQRYVITRYRQLIKPQLERLLLHPSTLQLQ